MFEVIQAQIQYRGQLPFTGGFGHRIIKLIHKPFAGKQAGDLVFLAHLMEPFLHFVLVHPSCPNNNLGTGFAVVGAGREGKGGIKLIALGVDPLAFQFLGLAFVLGTTAQQFLQLVMIRG